jgi:hypothetical protein
MKEVAMTTTESITTRPCTACSVPTDRADQVCSFCLDYDAPPAFENKAAETEGDKLLAGALLKIREAGEDLCDWQAVVTAQTAPNTARIDIAIAHLTAAARLIPVTAIGGAR